MGWLDALAGIVGDAAGSVASGVGSAFDWSEQHGKEWMGDLQYILSDAFEGLPGESIIPGQGAREVTQAYEQGYNGYTGGRAAWELMQSDNPLLVRGAFDVLNPADPINLAGYLTMTNAPRAAIGGLRAGTGVQGLPEFGQALRAQGGIGAQLAGAGIEAGSRAAWYGMRATELPGELGFRYLIGKPIGFTARNTVGRLGLLDPSQESRFSTIMGQIRLGANELTANRAGGTYRQQGMQRPIFTPDDGVAPVSTPSRFRGSRLATVVESAADAAWSRLSKRFGATAGIAAGGGVPGQLPQAPFGFHPGAIPKFTEQDMNDLAQFASAFIAGRMNETAPERQAFAMIDAIHQLPAEMGRATGYSAQSMMPMTPAILGRTGRTDLPSPTMFTPSGMPEGGAAIKQTRQSGNLFTQGDYSTGGPTTLSVGDELAAQGAGITMGARRPVNPNDPSAFGTGAGFRFGDELNNVAQHKVEINVRTRLQRQTDELPEEWDFLRQSKTKVVTTDDAGLLYLRQLADEGKITIKKVTPGAGFTPTEGFTRLLDDPNAVGPGGLSFGIERGGETISVRQALDEHFRQLMGPLWDQVDPMIKKDIWRRSVQGSYVMFVQAAQEAYMKPSKLAELYLDAARAGQVTGDLAGRYLSSYKRQYGALSKKYPVKKDATGRVSTELDEIAEDVIEEVDAIVSAGVDPFMDKITKRDLTKGLNLRKNEDRVKLMSRYGNVRDEMSIGPVSTTGASAVTPENPSGYVPNSMAAIFNQDVTERQAAVAVLNDPDADEAAKQLARQRLNQPEAFEDDPTIRDAEGNVVPRMSRNTHGQAYPNDVRAANPRGTYPINFSTLMHAIRQGVDLELNDRAVRQWYAMSVVEMDQLFGKGAIEDVHAFALMTAATSAQTGPEKNLEMALRLWTISLLENDPELLAAAGVDVKTAIKMNNLLNDLMRVSRGDTIGGQRTYTVTEKVAGKKVKRTVVEYPSEGMAATPGDRISAGDLPGLGQLTNMHTVSSGQALGQATGFDDIGMKVRGTPEWVDPVPAQGGSKFADYGGSFRDQSYRDSIAKAYDDDPKLRDEILGAWEASQAQFTIDRHQNTLNAFNIVVHPFMYSAGRAMGQQATRLANDDPFIKAAISGAKLMPQDVQAITWYYTKGAKGFSRRGEDFTDDLGTALKRRLEQIEQKTGRKFEAGSREQKIAVIQDMIEEIVSNKHLVDAGPITPGRLRLIRDELFQNVKKMQADGDPISYSYRLANPAYYKDVAGTAGLEPLNVIRGYTTTLGGTEMLPLEMTDDQIRAAIDEMLQRYQAVLTGPYADLVKIGFYPNDGKFSIDLNLVVGDEDTAIRIARDNNQIAAYNNSTGNDIEIGGTGVPVRTTGEEVNAYLDSVLTEKLSGQAMRRATGELGPSAGFQALGPNLLPPELEAMSLMLTQGLGYMRDYLRLFFDSYDGYQLKNVLGGFGSKLRGARKDVRMKNLKGMSRQLADELVNAAAPARNPLISEQANRVLYDQGFEQGTFAGETFGDVFEKLDMVLNRLQGEMQERGVRWVPDAPLETKLNLLGNSPTGKDLNKKVIKLLDKYQLDPLADAPEKLALSVIERELEGQFGLQHDRLTGMKLFRAAWGEQALFTPRYHAGNLLGSWMQNILGGHGANVNPVDFARNIRMAVGSNTEGFTNPLNSKWVQELDQWGLGSDVRQLNRSNATVGIVQNADATSRSAVGKLASKVVGDRAGKWIGKPFELNKQLSAGIEMNIRGSLAAETVNREMAERLPELARITAERMSREGIDMNGLTTDIFSGAPEQVKRRLTAAGLSDGQATHVSRQYANFRRNAMDKGLSEVNRIQFSYEYTKLDDLVARVIPFHYWASRAMRFYAEETLRHPVFIYDYVRLTEGIERMQNDPGLSARQKGFLRLMAGPTGFTLLMNPDALVGVVKSLKIDNTYEPDGETSLGGLIRRGKEHGLGLFPWIDGVMNYLGAYGDTFAPDPLGIRHRALVGAAINEFRAYTGMEPGTAPYEAFNSKLREFISTNFDAATPDWLGKPVAVKSSRDGTMATATLDDLVTTRIMANNPQLTNGELLEILNNPDSPEYETAYQQVAKAGLLQQLLNVTLPVNTRVRENTRDSARAGMNVIREAAKEAGMSPYDYEPSPADREFYETYKRLTGKDYQPGEYERAQFKRDIQTATPAARRFVIQKHEYDNLGSGGAQQLQQRFTQILNGEWFPQGVQPGQYPDDVLWNLAREWVSTQPAYGEYLQLKQLRDAYLQTHPEFAEYDTWRDSMYNVVATYGADGLSYYRQKVSESNPAAKNYFDRRMRYIIDNNPRATPDQIRQQLDQATISPDTWFAVSGRSMSQYDQQAPNAGGYYDPVVFNAPVEQPQSYGGGQGPQAPNNWMQALQTFTR